MFKLNEFAKEVHAEAVRHGWWTGEENCSLTTKVALIHAEWSEALEEYRAGRPMVWFECEGVGELPCVEEECPTYEDGACKDGVRSSKPEGIAVELIDGCIRILDLLAYERMDVGEGHSSSEGLARGASLPQLVVALHKRTSDAGMSVWLDYRQEREYAGARLSDCVALVRCWLEGQGLDFEQLMQMKHEYNETRSWRHGGKRC